MNDERMNFFSSSLRPFITKMSYREFVDEQENLMAKKFLVHRWLYGLVGVLTMIPIILLTLGQIESLPRESNELAFCLLLLVHSGCVVVSLVCSAVFCRVTDALLTTITLLLLAAYTGTHFYMRFLLNEKDLTVITLRLGFVLLLSILFLPWTNVMVYSYQNKFKQDTACSRAITFSWFLNLDAMLMISLMVLNIRSRADVGQYQLLTLSIGASLVGLWLILGKVLTRKMSRHWMLWTSFLLLSAIQILHLAYVTYWVKFEYDVLSKHRESNLLPLLIITFISGSTSVVVHTLTIFLSLTLFRS